MARWLCIKTCQFNGRFWDPLSKLEKDKVYVGEKQPPAKCFRPMAEGEQLIIPTERPKPVAISELQKKTVPADAQTVAHNAEGMAPVVDGKPVAPASAPAPAPPTAAPVTSAPVESPPVAPAQPEQPAAPAPGGQPPAAVPPQADAFMQ